MKSNSVKKTASPEKEKPKTKAARGTKPIGAAAFVPFILLVVSVIIESCLVFNTKTGAVGKYIHYALCGIIGAAAYLVPVGLLMMAFCFFEIRRKKSMPIKVITLVLFTLFFSASHSIIGDPELMYNTEIGVLFENGGLGIGGGVLGGLLGKLAVSAFDKTFAAVICIFICLLSLTFFVGARSIGIWPDVISLAKNVFRKKTKAPVKTAKEAVKPEIPADITPVPVINDTTQTLVETTLPAPIYGEAAFAEKTGERENIDPFAFGNIFNPDSEIELPSEEPEDFSDEAASAPLKETSTLLTSRSGHTEREPLDCRAENPMTAGVPLDKDGRPRAYSPFANPFVTREDILKNSQKKQPDETKNGKKRAYSPFADPLASMEDTSRQSHKSLPPQAYIACGAEYPASKASDNVSQAQASDNETDKNFIKGGSQADEVQAIPPEYSESQNSEQGFEADKRAEPKKNGIFGFFRKTDSMSEEYSEDIEDDDDEEEDIYTEEVYQKTSRAAEKTTPPPYQHAQAQNTFRQTQSKAEAPRESAMKPDYYSPPFDMDDGASKFSGAPQGDTGVRVVYGSELRYPDYIYPHFDLLEPPKPINQISENEIIEVRNRLLGKLASFKVEASLTGYSVGPTITRYELTPGPGVRVKQITALIEDLSLELQSDGVRIATVPGKAVIGVEVPNEKVSTVSLRALIENRDFINAKSKITVCVGLTVTGKPIYMDIDDMPHVLIAGETKSGKSVAINCMILSLLYRCSPDEVQLILIDPKRVELNVYSKIPHLVMPVIDDPKRAAAALRWAVNEMDRRYMLLDRMGVRNREEYCELRKEDPSLECMPQIIIVIDELADLMLQVREFVEELINRLAAMARACGMHLLVGTQRPSVDIITGLIKANIPARIAFKVSSAQDSRIILGGIGAEKLLGRGDMLYQATGTGRVRVQGAYVSGVEIKKIIRYIIENNGEAQFDPEVMRSLDAEVDKMSKNSKKATYTDDDEDGGGTVDGYEPDFDLLCQAIEYILETGKTSTNNIQRTLHVGFNRAADIVDALEDMGFISKREGSRPREVLVSWEMYEEWKMRRQL